MNNKTGVRIVNLYSGHGTYSTLGMYTPHQIPWTAKVSQTQLWKNKGTSQVI